jgi:hypothetical protein
MYEKIQLLLFKRFYLYTVVRETYKLIIIYNEVL